MNQELAEILQTRGRLLSDIQQQRQQLAVAVQPLRTPLAVADQLRQGLHWMRSHPLAVASTVTLFWLRRKSGGNLLWRAWRGWKMYQQLQKFLQKTSH